MSRKLTGSKKQTDTGWTASLPIRRGATKRRTYTFTTEEAADCWIAAGILAISGGTDLPAPRAEDRAANQRPQQTGTDFRSMADPEIAQINEGPNQVQRTWMVGQVLAGVQSES